MKLKWLLTALLAALVFPTAAFPHGVEVYNVTGGTPAVVQSLRFMYSTGEPMMYARIKLYAPSASDAEVLQTVTDRNGYFSFVPEGVGFWRVTVEDGMGHKGEITVNILAGGEGSDEKSASSQDVNGKPPLPLAALLGVSLILNVFSIWYFARRNRDKNAAPMEPSNAH